MDRLKKFGRYSKRVFKRYTESKVESPPTVSLDVDYNIVSVVNEDLREISWRIENIDGCQLATGQCYETPGTFSTGFYNEIKWAIRIYPNGRRIADRFAIFIHNVSESFGKDISINYFVEVELFPKSDICLDANGETYPYNEAAIEVKDGEKENREYGTDELFPSRNLRGKESLRVKCYLNAFYLEEENFSCITGPVTLSTLSDDLKEIYKSGRFSDVTLHVGEQTFPAHKAILAARSKVFSAMFEHEMKEKLTSEIPIENIEPSVMSSVLQYIYTGKVKALTVDDAIGIFSVADKYCLEELQKWCLGVMLSKLSVENVCQVAVLADMHSVPKLKAATNCMFRRHMHEIMKQKEWEKIIRERQQLASDMLQAVSSEFYSNAQGTHTTLLGSKCERFCSRKELDDDMNELRWFS